VRGREGKKEKKRERTGEEEGGMPVLFRAAFDIMPS
jgi:hypothetical protein